MMLVMGSLQSKAEDYPYLAFMGTDGSVKTVSVESLTLTVEDGQLVATNAAGTQRFTLTELIKMYFTSESTKIESIEISNEEGESVKEIFDMSGRAIAAKSLTKGIYVVKYQGKTRKIVVK